MKMSKLLQLLLAPFMLYVDGETAGGSSDDSTVDWGALNENVAPGSDDEYSGEDDPSPAPVPAPAPAPAPVPAPKRSVTNEEQNPDPNPEGEGEEGEETENLETDPALELAPEDSDEEQLTPEQRAAKDAEVAEKFKVWRAGQVETLEKTYAFDEETATRLQTEPELVLPKLAAEMHMNITQSVIEAVQRMMPQMLQPVMKNQDLEKQATDYFYKNNPDLNPKKHQKAVLEAGVMFRKLNPKATPEETARKVGEIVRQSLGLTPRVTGAPAPAAGKGKAAPHKPAGSGTGSGTKPAPAKKQVSDGDVDWNELID